MNLLEHYIEKIHSTEDVSNEFEKVNGYPPHEPLYRVNLTCDCYGQITRTTKHFFKSEWEKAQANGYFMA